MKRNLIAALALVALGLSACNEARTGGNAKICANFKAAKTALASGDGVGPLDECVRRGPDSLAPSRDDADVVAEAVVAACTPQLSRWNQQTLSQPTGEG